MREDFFYRTINNLVKEKSLYKVNNEYLKEVVMKSNIPIGDVCMLMSILNYPEDMTCMNESFFLPLELTNKELRRVINL